MQKPHASKQCRLSGDQPETSAAEDDYEDEAENAHFNERNIPRRSSNHITSSGQKRQYRDELEYYASAEHNEEPRLQKARFMNTHRDHDCNKINTAHDDYESDDALSDNAQEHLKEVADDDARRVQEEKEDARCAAEFLRCPQPMHRPSHKSIVTSVPKFVHQPVAASLSTSAKPYVSQAQRIAARQAAEAAAEIPMNLTTSATFNSEARVHPNLDSAAPSDHTANEDDSVSQDSDDERLLY
jgi:hypothetical protein